MRVTYSTRLRLWDAHPPEIRTHECILNCTSVQLFHTHHQTNTYHSPRITYLDVIKPKLVNYEAALRNLAPSPLTLIGRWKPLESQKGVKV